MIKSNNPHLNMNEKIPPNKCLLKFWRKKHSNNYISSYILRVKRLGTGLTEMVSTQNTLFFISFLALLKISSKADFNY